MTTMDVFPRQNEYFHEHGFVHKEKKLFQQMSKDDSRTTDVFRSVFRRYANIIVSND